MKQKNKPEFLHRKLLVDLDKEVKDLSIELQEIVGIFENLLAKTATTERSEDPEILAQLTELDKDIYDHVLTEFEFNLQHCHMCEEEMSPKSDVKLSTQEIKTEKPKFEKGNWVEITGGNPKYIGEVVKVLEYHPSSRNSKAPESVIIVSNKFPEGKALIHIRHIQITEKEPNSALKGDEKILDELMTIGMAKNIKKSSLEGLGFKTKLGGFQKTITIGQFQLIRTSVFLYEYRLVKQPPKTDAK